MVEAKVNSLPKASPLCQINGRLPSRETLRERLAAIGQVYGLSDGHLVDEDALTCFRQAIEVYLNKVIASFMDPIQSGLRPASDKYTVTETDLEAFAALRTLLNLY